MVVARKIEPLFRQKYAGRQDRFYDDLITRLFQDRLHLAARNSITFSRRGNKMRQHSLRAALELAKQRFGQRWKTQVTSSIEVLTNQPRQEPAVQAIDYAMWAVQRAFERNEMRYFEFLREKFTLIHDVFDAARYKGGQNYYTRARNPFDIKKISPLG